MAPEMMRLCAADQINQLRSVALSSSGDEGTARGTALVRTSCVALARLANNRYSR